MRVTLNLCYLDVLINGCSYRARPRRSKLECMHVLFFARRLTCFLRTLALAEGSASDASGNRGTLHFPTARPRRRSIGVVAETAKKNILLRIAFLELWVWQVSFCFCFFMTFIVCIYVQYLYVDIQKYIHIRGRQAVEAAQTL